MDGTPARWPLSLADLERATPVYATFPGWDAELQDVRRMADLPAEAAAYVDALEELAAVPITLVSVGPERTQTIIRTGRVASGPRRTPMAAGA